MSRARSGIRPGRSCDGGIGFYLPGELPTTLLLLHLPQTPQTPAMSVRARVVRVQQLVAGAAPGIAAKFSKRIECDFPPDTWCNPESLPQLEPTADDAA